MLVKLNTFSDFLQQKFVIVSIKDTGEPKTLGVICFLVHYHNFVLQRIAGGMADGVNQRHCGEFFSVCQYVFSLLRPKLVISSDYQCPELFEFFV
jgi:hypothetical protein